MIFNWSIWIKNLPVNFTKFEPKPKRLIVPHLIDWLIRQLFFSVLITNCKEVIDQFIRQLFFTVLIINCKEVMNRLINNKTKQQLQNLFILSNIFIRAFHLCGYCLIRISIPFLPFFHFFPARISPLENVTAALLLPIGTIKIPCDTGVRRENYWKWPFRRQSHACHMFRCIVRCRPHRLII